MSVAAFRNLKDYTDVVHSPTMIPEVQDIFLDVVADPAVVHCREFSLNIGLGHSTGEISF